MLDFLVAQLAHWPFIASAFVLSIVGQVMKNSLWTEENAKAHKLYSLGRKTLPLHPVVCGILMGVAWKGLPVSPGVEGASARVLYFAFSGVAATWLFALIKAWAKKEGYDVALPGESVKPEAPNGDQP